MRATYTTSLSYYTRDAAGTRRLLKLCALKYKTLQTHQNKTANNCVQTFEASLIMYFVSCARMALPFNYQGSN